MIHLSEFQVPARVNTFGTCQSHFEVLTSSYLSWLALSYMLAEDISMDISKVIFQIECITLGNSCGTYDGNL